MIKRRWDLLRRVLKPDDLVQIWYRNNWRPINRRLKIRTEFISFVTEEGIRFEHYNFHRDVGEERRISYRSIIRVKILPKEEPDAILTSEGWEKA